MPVPGGGGLERCYAVDPTNDAAPPDAATEDGGPPDAATDGALPDAAPRDAEAEDGGPPDDAQPDASLHDAAPPDAAQADASLHDAAPPDAAQPDGAPPDDAQPDASLHDAAPPDAAQPDASLPDAAPPDAAQPDAALPDGGTPCVDSDGDGYGEGCILGPDCDDDAPGITGACQANGCPQGWVHIPAGDFEMGCNSGELDGTCQASEQPRHTVTMTAYCMEVTEVSVGAYRECKEASVCMGTPVDSGGAYNWTASPTGREEHPINGINWAESREYCQVWVGGDLPTEAQWEKAARGGPGDLRKYTWGSSPEPDCTRANGWYGSYCNAARTWPVGFLTSTAGDSPYGLKDMAGNVWEWVLDYYSETFYQQCSSGCTDPENTSVAVNRVIRGGCYNDATMNLRAVARLVMNPADRVNNYGFRCSRAPVCVDMDGDGYGDGCALGPDCDDNAPGITGACQANGCPQGWVYIPAGDFEMGCNSGELNGTCLTNEQPRHTVTMTGYCVERTEVSVGAYRACKDSGLCTGTPATNDGWCNWSAFVDGREQHPINGINWLESRQYCQLWMGGDLPTEAQWEKAARGGPGDTRKYPWGATPEPDCTRANSNLCYSSTGPVTWPVGYLSSTLGDSPYGLKDMAGNVWEWVQDLYSSTFYQDCASGCTDPLNTSTGAERVFRGGCFNCTDDYLRVVWRLSMIPTGYHHAVGFRCSRAPACVDNDGDGYGDGCALGPDCDDNAPGIIGACQLNGCPQGWAYIPAGDFEMGCNSGELNGTCLADEQPRHTVTLGAYCMELTEVSVGEYRACKEASVCTGTPNETGGWYNWTESPGAREAHPVNGIFWAESQQYCQAWMGGDLPTEAEWEKGARGGPGDTRKYPWGATPEPDCTRANFDVNGPASGYGCDQVAVGPGTWPVGYLTTTLGDSPYGLKDMAGNAWEWVQDYYSATFYSSCTSGCSDPLNTTWATQRVYRAGGFDGAATYLRVVWRGAGDPTYRGNFITFRCRRTL